jgi:hypothetical protein
MTIPDPKPNTAAETEEASDVLPIPLLSHVVTYKSTTQGHQ